VKKVCDTTYLVEDLPAKRKKTKFRRFNAHMCQIRRLPSVAATETVCEEQQPGQPREPKELGPEDRLAHHVAQRLRTALTTA
jgi:hypothetical protein